MSIENLGNKQTIRKQIWSQVLDHYLPRISIITSHYGLLTTEILLPISSNQSSHQKQTEDRELDLFSYRRKVQSRNNTAKNKM